MDKPFSKVSLGDIAKAVGISKATVSYVLRNQPGPSQETRERVLQVAGQLGYTPDARIVSQMTRVRDATAKSLVPIAWIDTNWEKDSWEKYKFLSPYLEGARARALQSGYQIEKIWAGQPGMTMRRIAQIVYQRGIEAVIITPQASHIRMNWDKLAPVTIEGGLMAPRVHRVVTDYTFNLLLALKMVRRYGYRRIGVCMDRLVGRGSYNACHAATYYFQATLPKGETIPPLYTASKERPMNRNYVQNSLSSWVRQHRPDVIVGHDSRLVQMVEAAGYRVPEDIGVVHIATDDDVSDWAGVNSKRREIGGAAAGWVISLLQNRQFGLPATAMNIGIRGTWHHGRTLLVPKRK